LSTRSTLSGSSAFVDNRTFQYDIKVMDGPEFVRRAKRYAKKTRQDFRFEKGHGKGSHGRLYIGDRFTTIQRGELKPGTFRGMLTQLEISKEDF